MDILGEVLENEIVEIQTEREMAFQSALAKEQADLADLILRFAEGKTLFYSVSPFVTRACTVDGVDVADEVWPMVRMRDIENGKVYFVKPDDVLLCEVKS